MADSQARESSESKSQTTRRSWRQFAAWLAFGAAAIAALVGGIYWMYEGRASNPAIEILVPTPAPIAVQASGAIVKPGVYELPRDARVEDLLDAAGGPLSDADVASMNLAQPLVDGQRVDVPWTSQAETASSSVSSDEPIGTTAATAIGLIDLNTATKSELETLPNIGPSRADLIIAYRKESGPIRSVDDLLAISGIGPVTVDSIRGLVLQP